MTAKALVVGQPTVGNNIEQYAMVYQVSTVTSSITRIRPIIYIEDPKEAPSIDYAYVENTKAEETTMVDIITTSHPVRSNATSIINLNAS